ncbi:MAG: bifunctional DNA-formamidopyrimidine glycosylase/DNA-(apurinic or apyrimidinic site) lyase [candidate division KSB1 bacterium]|nr:bifunctional DNA-formamidopyrimidine glycosylase/DNA-(apurinic or apyrimidinic site) lyase [candidate division KSB1 bacterium]MDZ7274950.1 bifunctional DNA-formamidopyrimidine glycosylase/DNA-(apurinic or apyrimidinic site) lyase [candidate division KSB1 bacterium]MDZ7286599.1 bifunctional DNA-formamidopyrimidine glycosylase/DNA-(apurinic or apyrimidinic site) lyase [candidate division KSB1 bacterium]MDZ7299237.1 bifunctional DNA-formamidopyrimidine glycosylase/DNA-(apurinic or apyrimidinic s
MPELPEVETVRRGLQQALVGKKITAVSVRETRLRVPVSAGRLRRWIAGQRVVGVTRRAKYLLCRMQNEAHLLIHLGMSGRLLWCEAGRALDKHDHVRFALEDGSELRFRDSRRFGLVEAVAPHRLADCVHLQHLGLEPLSPQFQPERLYDQTRGLARPIKNYLMDASKIAGVGNIYANEALFRAGLRPQRPAGRLKLEDWRRLVAAVRETLELAIANGGTTLSDFYNSNGEMGYFQQHLKVYSRAGEACLTCGATIKRVVQVGRSSFYCPHCQK